MDVIRVPTSGLDVPVAAAAVHDGNEVRAGLGPLFALTPEERRREEDPHTGSWAVVAPLSFVATRSRFEFDLNRPRDKAVYLRPEDAWGLHVWREEPSPAVVEESLRGYDRFYAVVREHLDRLAERHERFVVLDLHTYNHRRAGRPADPAQNPEVNVGTGTMDRPRWAAVLDTVFETLLGFDFLGRRLDVRENVRFLGGHFSHWVHETYPDNGCCIALEFKKFFMDEWTGKADDEQVGAIGRAVAALVDALG